MKSTKTKTRINIKVSKRAYDKLSATARFEGRTILATLDKMLGV